MNIRDYLKKQVIWLKESDPVFDIAVSSRIRLARNLEKYHFKNRMNEKEEIELNEELKNIFKNHEYLKTADVINLETIDPVERYFLMERHLVSKEHAEYNGKRSVIISEDEKISIMINEEDHIRMQSVLPGLQLFSAYKVLDEIDTEVQKHVKYAFSPDWGYLTSCPTNIGTGIRASVMLHLPCLVLTKEINKVLNAIPKLGLTVRGLYGEGTAASGDFFQVSNQVTLGFKEEDIINNIEKICSQIISHESNARNILYKKEKIKLEDKICRAYGILKNARIISYNETIELLSSIRLGISLGVFSRKLKTVFDELLVITQPAHIQLIENKKLKPIERDIKRAEIIREKVGMKTEDRN